MGLSHIGSTIWVQGLTGFKASGPRNPRPEPQNIGQGRCHDSTMAIHSSMVVERYYKNIVPE